MRTAESYPEWSAALLQTQGGAKPRFEEPLIVGRNVPLQIAEYGEPRRCGANLCHVHRIEPMSFNQWRIERSGGLSQDAV
jgi:hypothetical protein